MCAQNSSAITPAATPKRRIGRRERANAAAAVPGGHSKGVRERRALREVAALQLRRVQWAKGADVAGAVTHSHKTLSGKGIE